MSIRHFWRLFAVVVLLISFGVRFTSPAAADKAIDRVAIVTPASRSNQGWDQQGVDTLEAVGKAKGLKVDVVENAGYDDITPILDDLKNDGTDLIFCHASGYQTVCPEFAAESEISVVVIENPKAVSPGLVADIETQAQESSFLAGIVSGLETKTGTVAIVVSGQPPTWNYMAAGFAEGLHAVNPEAKLLYQVIGEAAYDDAPNAKRVTESVIAAGADIVFGMGDGASFGMVQAINDHNSQNASGAPVQFIDVIGDKSGTDAGKFLLTSVLFDYTGAYTAMLDGLEHGLFGEVYTMNLENGGVHLLDLGDRVKPETAKAVADYQQQIIAGKVKVSAIPDADGLRKLLDQLFPNS